MEVLKQHSIKIQLGTLATLIGIIIYYTFMISSQHERMSLKIEANHELAEKNKAVIVQLQNASKDNEISLAEINANLRNIDKTLIEIKTDLKEHDRYQ